MCLPFYIQSCTVTPNGEAPLISTLLLLCQLLKDHTASAREDLVRASIYTPMYGVIQSIRTVVETFHWKPTPAAREVVRGLLEVSVQVSHIVSPVVCSSSPEGFLPDKSESETDKVGLAETSQMSVAETDKEGVAVEGRTASSGTAQSLLLCCWHSMKEISLLLGYLAGELPVISEANKDGGLLSEDQVQSYTCIEFSTKGTLSPLHVNIVIYDTMHCS